MNILFEVVSDSIFIPTILFYIICKKYDFHILKSGMKITFIPLIIGLLTSIFLFSIAKEETNNDIGILKFISFLPFLYLLIKVVYFWLSLMIIFIIKYLIKLLS